MTFIRLCTRNFVLNCQNIFVRAKHVGSNTRSNLVREHNKSHTSDMIRNIGIIAHIDAGKTTTTERMLFFSGLTRTIGDVDDGDTVMDYMDQERNRGITITSAAITFMWNKHRINLIDTPGHVDFTLEVERSLRVLDGAITILDASAGVEAQTLTVWRQADRYNVPRIVYCNKMDKTTANFEFSVNSLIEKFNVLPLVIQIPVGVGKDFAGVVDLINIEKMDWSDTDENGQTYIRTSLDKTCHPSLYEEFYEKRKHLVEDLADINESVAEYVLNDTDHLDIPNNVIHNAVRQATLERKGVAVLCGSSFKNKSVQPLMDAVIKYLPNPNERPHSFVKYYKNDLCALAFKFVHDKQRGPLAFCRIYSGELKSGSSLYNVNSEHSEKIGKLLQVYADDHKEITHASAGNIVAIAGLKETGTGDTLTTNVSAANAAKREAANIGDTIDEEFDVESISPVLAGMVIPDPVFFCSIEVESLAYQKQLDHALACLTKEDPSVRVHIDEDTGQMVLSGMGELHLEIIQSRIKEEYGVEVDLGPLQIAYKESLIQPTKTSSEIDKTIGKDRHQVSMCVSIQPTGSSQVFTHVEVQPDKGSEMDPKRIKKHVLQAINNGVKSSLSRGPLLGFPVTDVEVKLHDLKIKYGTSLPMITGCAAQATHSAIQKAGAFLLEPKMYMEIYTDEHFLSTVLGDLTKRRSQINEVQARGDGSRTVICLTPLSNLVGYATTLRTISSGTASFSMELSHYERMTEYDQETAIAQVTGFTR